MSDEKKLRLSHQLFALAENMDRVAADMMQHGGKLYAQHSKELAGAADMARDWAKNIRECKLC